MLHVSVHHCVAYVISILARKWKAWHSIFPNLFLQVELSCTSGTLDITYVVSLYPESMASAVLVQNNGRKALDLTSAILSHIKFKKRAGSGIQGLQGCSYCSQPPLSSPFEIISPGEAMKADDPGLFSFSSESPSKLGEWITQDEPIIILKNKFSRVYSAPPSERSKKFYRTPPSKYETIDQVSTITEFLHQ